MGMQENTKIILSDTEKQIIEDRKKRLADKIIKETESGIPESEMSELDIYNLCLLNKWTDNSQNSV